MGWFKTRAIKAAQLISILVVASLLCWPLVPLFAESVIKQVSSSLNGEVTTGDSEFPLTGGSPTNNLSFASASNSGSTSKPTLTPTPTPTPLSTGTPGSPQATGFPKAGAGQIREMIAIDLMGYSKTIRLDASGATVGETEIISPDRKIGVTVTDQTKIMTAKNGPPASITITVEHSLPELPSGASIVGFAYQCFPGGTTFDPAIALTWYYDPSGLPPGTDESKLQAVFFNQSARRWESVKCSVDLEKHSLTASVGHFSQYAVVAPVAKQSAVVTPVVGKLPVVTQTPAQSVITQAPVSTLTAQTSALPVQSQSLSQPLTTPSVVQKPPTLPYNPIFVVVQFVVWSAVGLVAILLWKNKNPKRRQI